MVYLSVLGLYLGDNKKCQQQDRFSFKKLLAINGLRLQANKLMAILQDEEWLKGYIFEI